MDLGKCREEMALSGEKKGRKRVATKKKKKTKKSKKRAFTSKKGGDEERKPQRRVLAKLSDSKKHDESAVDSTKRREEVNGRLPGEKGTRSRGCDGRQPSSNRGRPGRGEKGVQREGRAKVPGSAGQYLSSKGRRSRYQRKKKMGPRRRGRERKKRGTSVHHREERYQLLLERKEEKKRARKERRGWGGRRNGERHRLRNHPIFPSRCQKKKASIISRMKKKGEASLRSSHSGGGKK